MEQLTTFSRLTPALRAACLSIPASLLLATLASGCGSSGPGTGMPATTLPPSTGAPAPASGAPNPGPAAAGQPGTAQPPQRPMMPAPMMPAPTMPPPQMPTAGMLAPTSGGAGAAGMTAAAGSPAMAPAGGCDRKCLVDVLSSYLTALTKKDPSMAKFTDDVRFTENGMELKLGEGLWTMATGVRENTRVDFADPMQSNVGAQLVVETGSAALILNVRLKVVEGSISEVETLVIGASAPVTPDFMGAVPDPLFIQPIEPGKRASREELLQTAQGYEKLLESGSAKMSGVKLHPDMVRLENGRQTADAASLNGREGGMARGDIPSRWLVVDEEYGLVFGVFEFGTILCPNELFKIMDGQIRLLNIVINAQSGDGWD